MPFFCVLIEGSNLCIPGEQDGSPIAGFFTSRIVWALDSGTAEVKALRSVREVWESGDHATQPTADELVLTVSKTWRSSFRRWLQAPNKGHTFFPAEPEGAASLAVPAD